MNNKFGVLSFICGICGAVCLYFYINTLDGEIAYLTSIVGIASFYSGIIQLIKAKIVKAKWTGFAITGIILSSLVLGVLFVFIELLRNVDWSFG